MAGHRPVVLPMPSPSRPPEGQVEYSVERSRKQVMARLGKKGEKQTCHGFKFGEGKEHASEHEAMRAAQAWAATFSKAGAGSEPWESHDRSIAGRWPAAH